MVHTSEKPRKTKLLFMELSSATRDSLPQPRRNCNAVSEKRGTYLFIYVWPHGLLLRSNLYVAMEVLGNPTFAGEL
jgi:hypothetical protein